METFHGRFYIGGEFREKYVTVDDGKIVEVSSEPLDNRINSLPGYILPGGVDIHVHFREPGETYKEDFHTGSMSSIFGGTTTVCDMPNNLIPILDRSTFINKVHSIGNRSYVDFCLYQAASVEIVEEAIGQKIFLGKSTGGLLTDMENAVWSEKLKVVHAELQTCLDKRNFRDESLSDHDRARPLECELEAIESMFGFKLDKVHIAHLTSLRSLELSRKLGFTTEVTPHHLLLNNSMDLGSFGKVNPPLRKKTIQEELLNNINSEDIDVISSDHAPHSLSDKSDFSTAPSGIPGVETRVPLILSLSQKGFLSLQRAVHYLMERPSEIAGINKGYIAKGFDADFCIFDLKGGSKVEGDSLHSKAGWTPFEDFDAIFPSEVFLRGELIVQDGELVSVERGRFINGKQ
jgi:dihydroorotase